MTRELAVRVCEEMTGMAEVNERWVKGPRIRHAGKSEQAVRARQDHAPNLVESDQDYRVVPSRLAH